MLPACRIKEKTLGSRQYHSLNILLEIGIHNRAHSSWHADMLTRAVTGAVRTNTRSSSTTELTVNRLQRPLLAGCNRNRNKHIHLGRSVASSVAGGNPYTASTAASAQLSVQCRHATWPAKVTKPFSITCKSTNGYADSNGPSGFHPSGTDSGASGSSSSSSSNGGGNNPPRARTTQAHNDDGNNKSGPEYPVIKFPWVPFCFASVCFLINSLVNVWQKAQLRATCRQHTEQLEELSCIVVGSSQGLGVKDSFAAVKRLLQEVFAEQLGVKQRLESLEKAAADELEAADDYQLRLTGTGTSSSWNRSPVRVSGFVTAAGILPWSQEPSASNALSVLSALGASGQADGRLQLHSVLAGGKRRVTAEIGQAAADHDRGTPLLQLTKLLYRVQLKNSVQLLIAPMRGSLDAIARSLTPRHSDYGCSQPMRQGHGLSAYSSTGSGKAISVSKGRLLAAAGFFVGGFHKTSLAQLQLKGHEGHSVSLVAARCQPRSQIPATHDTHDHISSSSGMRFLGVQTSTSKVERSAAVGTGSTASTVIGAAGVLPIKDSLTATAWAEKPSGGSAGWGVGLYTQPDPDGLEVGMVLGRPSAHHAAFRVASAPVYCELTAKVPVGAGLSIAPGAILLCGAKRKATLAYLMQSSWRF